MAKMHMTLGEQGADEDETYEDVINRIMESRQMLMNASYFAFTATPKNKTLEMFGESYQEEGKLKFRPCHNYSMKQAIDEGFILDVLERFTPVQSYYHLIKTVQDDPKLDIKRAHKKLRRYVETHEYAIRKKAEIMVDHFHNDVLAKKKIGGAARAMVVTSSIAQAIEYKRAFDDYLSERRSPYKAIVAFSGEHEVAGKKMDEADMNDFPSAQIPKRFRKDPYRFLIVADKFQTGYDEPLLHTMYVDKVLAGARAVQTLSRLNRAHPQKRDTFILDFANKSDVIQEAFAPYYRTTILSESTDPNKLHDLKADLDARQVYTQEDIDQLVELFLSGASREDSRFDPILNKCVATYRHELDEDAQVDFKGKAKAFLRTYSFLATVLTFTNVEWEKLSIFLNLLVPKLPAPKEEDLSKGVLEMIDLESYRSEVKSQILIALPDEDAEIAPVPTEGGGGATEPELDFLSNIVREFNEYFGNIEWHDGEKIRKVIAEELPAKVANDTAYQNASKNSNKQTAKLEHDRALADVITGLVSDHTELFKQFMDNPSFKKWLSDRIFQATYDSLK
jgi:type I restriction enzyme R subunit